MKKLFSLLMIFGVALTINAQTVSETVTLYGKEQLNGFSVTVPDATGSIAEAALVEKFEKQFGLKGKKSKNFHVYLSQPCQAFGDQNYDIYFTTQDVGKKKNRSAQIILVVSTGNQNCITMAKDPRTARSIMSFLEGARTDVEIYKTQLQIDELNKKMEVLKKEKQSLEKEQLKIKEKMNKTSEDMKVASSDIEIKNAEMTKLQATYNVDHNPDVKALIDKTAKEAQTLQKSQSNMRKSLLKLNNDLEKTNKKIESNDKEIKKIDEELRRAKQ